MTVSRLIKYHYTKFLRNHFGIAMFGVIVAIFGSLIGADIWVHYAYDMIAAGSGAWYHYLGVMILGLFSIAILIDGVRANNRKYRRQQEQIQV